MTTRDFYSTGDHYKRLWEQVAAIPNATVADAINVMREMANDGWFEADPNIDQTQKGKGFRYGEPAAPMHEMSYLIMRAGHTPFQECFSGAFQRGLEDAFAHPDDKIEHFNRFHKSFNESKASYYPTDFTKKNKAGVSIEDRSEYQPRDMAISYAAGIYMRYKFDSFVSLDVSERPYAEQLAFAKYYADHDEYLWDFDKMNMPEEGYNRHYLAMPAEMLKLSPKEWRAIIAVATGMTHPDDTPYPQRLAPVYEIMTKELPLIGNARDTFGESEHWQNLIQRREADKTPKHTPIHGWDGSKRPPPKAKDDSGQIR